MRQFFNSSERIRNTKQINCLFSDGKSFFAYPFRVVFMQEETSDAVPLKVIFVVSKRHFKSAVRRNRIRRQMREAWRKSKNVVFSEKPSGRCILAAIQYTAPKEETYGIMEEKIKLILQRLHKHHEQTAD
jgi:ribonuclease P protein component